MAGRTSRGPEGDLPESRRLSRRNFLKAGAAGAGVVAVGMTGTGMAASLLARGPGAERAQAGGLYIEKLPTSPLILDPFTEALPVPRALRPEPKSEVDRWKEPPGPGFGQQDSDGGTHQLWSSGVGYPDPLVYRVALQVAPHSFTSARVLPIDSKGKPVASFDEQRKRYAPGTVRRLPASTIYGFNGTFPGPMINNEYGRPSLVRFVNELDQNPYNLDRQDFGSPELGFLTHLHNAHTASESDGNPFHKDPGYHPGQWVDNLYLNYPAGGDETEKQSFFWFHDHYMDHTSSNVYKGMVGLFPIYDPTNSLDMGDETRGLRLPGVRTNNGDGSFDVEYDIPLALYDCALDDGSVPHKDIHSGRGESHPEWWGKTFFKHQVNHGFVGDIFTVNGKAFPVLEVRRRKYRLRFLDASISRIYQLSLMRSPTSPQTAVSLGYGGPELQGQYRLPNGEQCMRMTQIATDGGLLPAPIVRDSFELWPAKRREFIVDFTRYMDGSPTRKGDVIYLVNTMKMTDGRIWDSPDPRYKVPVLKIIIGDDAPDNSVVPAAMRALPPLPSQSDLQSLIDNRRVFRLERGGGGDEAEWLINGEPFDHSRSYASPRQGSREVWEIKNGGGGWVHPMHIHMEEHQTLSRDGVPAPDGRHPDDRSREDVIALDDGESVLIYRRFRSFLGRYVAHCHNLMHEDHAMMFGWDIVP